MRDRLYDRFAGIRYRVFGKYGIQSLATDGRTLAPLAAAGRVRVVYSPAQLAALAAEESTPLVFLGIGFETTAPANVMAVVEAKRQRLTNFSVLVSHVCVPPAMHAILGAASHIQGFLLAGHVCTVMGYEEYFPIAARHRVPIVVVVADDRAWGIVASGQKRSLGGPIAPRCGPRRGAP